MIKIVCTIAGTSSYLFAIAPCVRRIQAAVYHARQRREIEFTFVGMTDKAGAAHMAKALPKGSPVVVVGMAEAGVRYKEEAQILIANLQQLGFDKAVELGADFCWSVEADILVPHNALSCMLDMLVFDDGYYDVAFVTYPSQSGGAFLGGYGTPSNPIAEDFLPGERNIPEDLAARLAASEKVIAEAQQPKDEAGAQALKATHAAHAVIMEEVKACPPKGNVFELNAKQWRRRGWLDNAYPAIGRGAVLETDWMGLGCNLLSCRALALASFDGYDGKGTQDLFLCWRRWKAAGLRFCVITHTVCEHIVSDNAGGRVNAMSHHEPQGDHAGHLRVQHRPFYKFDGQDKYTLENDGVIKTNKSLQQKQVPC